MTGVATRGVGEVPRRSALRYQGAKWHLAPWIIHHLPPHTHYVEVFGGSAAVLLQKLRSKVETYNDAYGEVVHFFRILRERPGELVTALELTPYAREEYQQAADVAVDDDDVERARRFFVTAWMSLGAGKSPSRRARDWRYIKHADKAWKSPAETWCALDHLFSVADRLKGVQIESADALAVLRRYDTPSTLFYLDPPYLASTRKQPVARVYAHEMSDAAHRLLLKRARAVQGYVMISGYANALYRRGLEAYGWARLDAAPAVHDGRRVHRTESVWLSPRTCQALQGSLFTCFDHVGGTHEGH